MDSLSCRFIFSCFETVIENAGLLRARSVVVAEVLGAETGSALEVFAEDALRGEVELLGYLLDIEVAAAQQNFGLKDDVAFYPVGGAEAGVAAQRAREVLGGDVEPRGVELKEALFAVVLLKQVEELFGDAALGGGHLVGVGTVGLPAYTREEGSYLKDRGPQGVGRFGVGRYAAQPRVELVVVLHILRIDSHNLVAPRGRIGRYVGDAVVEFLVKPWRHDDAAGIEVLTDERRGEDLVGPNVDHRRSDNMVLRQRDLRPTFTPTDEDRGCGREFHGIRDGSEHGVVDALKHPEVLLKYVVDTFRKIQIVIIVNHRIL